MTVAVFLELAALSRSRSSHELFPTPSCVLQSHRPVLYCQKLVLFKAITGLYF